MSNLIPVQLTKVQLEDILGDMLARVKVGDSWEGNIEYMMPDEEGYDFAVRGVYRIGNRDGGQGGVRMIGDVPIDDS